MNVKARRNLLGLQPGEAARGRVKCVDLYSELSNQFQIEGEQLHCRADASWPYVHLRGAGPERR